MLNASLSLKTGEHQVQVKIECLMKRECLEQQLGIIKVFPSSIQEPTMFGYFHFVTWFRVVK